MINNSFKKFILKLFCLVIFLLFFSILFSYHNFIIAHGDPQWGGGCCKYLGGLPLPVYEIGQCVGYMKDACINGLDQDNYQWVEGGTCEGKTPTLPMGICTGQQVFIQPPSTPPLTLHLQIPIPGMANPEITINGDTIGTYISYVYRFFVGALSIIAVVMIMIGGFQWLMAAGSAEKVSHAKETIFGAIIGLVLALTSYLLLYTINPNLVQFKSLTGLEDDIEPSNLSDTCYSSDDCDLPKKCVFEQAGSQIGECQTRAECEFSTECLAGESCQYDPIFEYKTCQPSFALEYENECCDANGENCLDDNCGEFGFSLAPYCVAIPPSASGLNVVIGICTDGSPGSPCYEDDDCNNSVVNSCNMTTHTCVF